ncbi:M56 family metallopeptidase [Bacillus suaedae]|uniref:DUF4825 domain-containing protein n=1 Tax=Halalkalibacter suaedae TaxID=2822140 RepID=A0A940WVY0_9BACI|nr:M56 family metallopeptidase [Bacillus suaedae]MBP3951572.1 DUF4825 domain-containing protein [Bacillus suaedae]
MSEVLKMVLSLSLAGSILALILFALKPFVKHRLSKTIQYYLWLVILIRLVFPFSFENSMMNDLFYNDNRAVEQNKQVTVTLADNEGIEETHASVKVNGNEISNALSNGEANSTEGLGTVMKFSLSYLWLAGVIVVLSINLFGYMKFKFYLNRGNQPAAREEEQMLNEIVKRRIRLKRNRFIGTPMLVGIFRPMIIIPDIPFTDKQLRNVLLHEVTHFKRFDVGVKWLIMIVTSIHWFNPLMYIVRKEINRACELACDEAVIKHLNPSEKQEYGETLLAVVAENNVPVGTLQATLSEEKKTLKERLLAIMNHRKKSKTVIIGSVLLFSIITLTGAYLGAGIGMGQNGPAPIYISAEGEPIKEALIGSYSWDNVIVNSDHPIQFNYQFDNALSVTGNQQLNLSTQKMKNDKQYDFTVKKLEVYKNGELVEGENKAESPLEGYGDVYINAPAASGEYIYSLILDYPDKGTVSYGFKVRVDMMTYDLTEISKHKTPYIGANGKVSSLAQNLPVPDSYFQQRFISMETDQTPYKLTVYYEPASNRDYNKSWPITVKDSVLEANSRSNALVLFSMIDNLDEVTLAYRISQSNGQLDEAQYDTTFTFVRKEFEDIYGGLGTLRDDLEILEHILTGK